jgi:transposase
VAVARERDQMTGVRVIGIDETSVKKGHEYVTVVHDLKAKRLLFMTPGRAHDTVACFKRDLTAHGGIADEIKHVCMDMSAAYAKGVTETLPQAQISYDRFHVIALANAAMDEVRREEMRSTPKAVKTAVGDDRKAVKSMMWAMRKNPPAWSFRQVNTMHWLQRSNLKSARAWRLKQALREVYRHAVASSCAVKAEQDLLGWISWARRCRLEPFKRLAITIKERLAGVVRGMLDGRSNAYVEAMNGMLQQAKTAARGFRTVTNFIAIAYLRMGKLRHLPSSPLCAAVSREKGVTRHFA